MAMRNMHCFLCLEASPCTKDADRVSLGTTGEGDCRPGFKAPTASPTIASTTGIVRAPSSISGCVVGQQPDSLPRHNQASQAKMGSWWGRAKTDWCTKMYPLSSSTSWTTRTRTKCYKIKNKVPPLERLGLPIPHKESASVHVGNQTSTNPKPRRHHTRPVPQRAPLQRSLSLSLSPHSPHSPHSPPGIAHRVTAALRCRSQQGAHDTNDNEQRASS